MGRLKRALPKLMLTLLAACISLKPTEVRAEESLLEAWERQNQAATGENHNNVPQLKEEDILRMNQGNADFLYNDEGYVTFLSETKSICPRLNNITSASTTPTTVRSPS